MKIRSVGAAMSAALAVACVFDPVHCALEAGVGQITIDVSDVDELVSNSWLRFDLDDALVDADLISAELTITVGPDPEDGSPSTGELWTTEPFDLMSIGVADPVEIERVGIDQGVALIGEEVTWSIPVELVVAGESLHLALLPVSTEGLDLWGDASDLPPRLVVTAM